MNNTKTKKKIVFASSNNTQASLHMHDRKELQLAEEIAKEFRKVSLFRERCALKNRVLWLINQTKNCFNVFLPSSLTHLISLLAFVYDIS